MNTKNILKSFKDFFKLKDTPAMAADLKGHVVVKDLDGNIILEKDNLIVLRGRTYVLELLFGQDAPADSGYIVNRNRTVCMFKIGQGGADINSAPFNPFVPKFSDEDLYQSVPFVIEDPDKENDPNKQSNPSIVSELSEEDKEKYFLPISRPDGSTAYYGKVFEPDGSNLTVNKATGEVYQRLTMRIEPTEARGFMVNELGLIMAEKKNGDYIDAELFSRVTFDTESLTSLSKGVIIDYYVHA